MFGFLGCLSGSRGGVKSRVVSVPSETTLVRNDDPRREAPISSESEKDPSTCRRSDTGFAGKGVHKRTGRAPRNPAT